jgi:hypothetical protein
MPLGERAAPFLIELETDGAITALHVECPDGYWDRMMKRLDDARTPYLFYDPFDAPEYYSLSWSRLDRAAMERLMGDTFEDADFVGGETPPTPGRTLGSKEFPPFWSFVV